MQIQFMLIFHIYLLKYTKIKKIGNTKILTTVLPLYVPHIVNTLIQKWESCDKILEKFAFLHFPKNQKKCTCLVYALKPSIAKSNASAHSRILSPSILRSTEPPCTISKPSTRNPTCPFKSAHISSRSVDSKWATEEKMRRPNHIKCVTSQSTPMPHPFERWHLLNFQFFYNRNFKTDVSWKLFIINNLQQSGCF